MAKCPNCGRDVETGMKFCGECGTAIPQTQKCPKCGMEMPSGMKFCGGCGYRFGSEEATSPIGLSLGDKNVIAGDVNSTVNNTSTVNNVTNVVNQDESKKMVSCVVCEKPLLITDAFRCSECHQYVCKDHYDAEKMLCDNCVANVAIKAESAYKDAVRNVLRTSGMIAEKGLRSLLELGDQLGLSGERQSELIIGVGLCESEHASAVSQADQSDLDMYLDWMYDSGIAPIDSSLPDAELALPNLDKYAIKYPCRADIVESYLHCLMLCDRKSAEIVSNAKNLLNALIDDGVDIPSVHAFQLLLSLQPAVGDMGEAEVLSSELEKRWPEDLLIGLLGCQMRIALYNITHDEDLLICAEAALASFDEAENRFQKSLLADITHRLAILRGQNVPLLTDDYCAEHGVYGFIARGGLFSGPTQDYVCEEEKRIRDAKLKAEKEMKIRQEEKARQEAAAKKLADAKKKEEQRKAELVRKENERKAEEKKRIEAEKKQAEMAVKSKTEIPKIIQGLVEIAIVEHDEKRKFLMMATQVTQEMWWSLMGENPASHVGDGLPVEMVSHHDVMEFVTRLNQREDVKIAKLRFRLPTVDEWICACLAGGKSEFGKIGFLRTGSIEDMGWFRGNSGNETHPVAQMKPNAWGLFDMHGNVAEWTSTSCGSSSGGFKDGAYQARKSWGSFCVGGAYNSDAQQCTAQSKTSEAYSTKRADIGFRLCADRV